MKQKIIKIAIMVIIVLVLYFFMLPPLNISSPAFWSFLFTVLVILFGISMVNKLGFNGITFYTKEPVLNKTTRIILIIIGVVFAGLILINIINSPLFNSRAYYERIAIKEDGNFTTDVKEVNFNEVPLLDKASSEKLGDRVMGQMPDLVSQFTVSDQYTQVNYNTDIVRVTPLEYADIIRYITNRKNGTEGYIIVNSVTGKSELVRLEEGMKYMPSAILFEKLERKLRFDYPTEIFGQMNFEIDNSGKPYWIVSTIKYVGIGLRPEVDGAIIFDPVTGNSQKYEVNEIPAWVDNVYPSQLIISQTNDWGKYKNGFINSILGQKDVVATTSGYNYLKLGDDIYLYTGITSVITDESNIGFILTNLRTKETTFYSVAGAEEYSAMASAEGQVQQMKYKSTFPLLINLNNKPTYLVSLKDNAGLVKMYGFIDVQDYQKVVVTDSSEGIEKAARNYLGNEEINVSQENLVIEDIEIQSITSAVIDGVTKYFITDVNGNKYKASVKVNEDKLPYATTGTILNISYKKGEGVIEIIKVN